ncbi:MAG: bifunctional YncE family protein/alkaline phosphatase family protein [Pseudomonadota bacterium]
MPRGWLRLLMVLVLGAPSCGGRDDAGVEVSPDLAGIDVATDAAHDAPTADVLDGVDAFIPQCRGDDECGGAEICRGQVCRAPVYPAVLPAATQRATYALNSENVLISGKEIRPAGIAVFVGTQPDRIALTPDGRYAVTNDATWGSKALVLGEDAQGMPGDYFLRTIDLETMAVVSEVAPDTGRLWHGLTLHVGQDGLRVYATNGNGQGLHEFALDGDGQLVWLRTIPFPGCYTTDVVLNAAGGRAWVTCLTSMVVELTGRVMVLDLESEIVTETSGALPGAFSLHLAEDLDLLFAASIAQEVRTPGGDPVWALDPETLEVVETLHVGLGPEGMVRDPLTGDLWVACNRTDDLWRLDPVSLEVLDSLSLHDEPMPIKGMYPVWLDVDAESRRLYVALSHENAIGVVDLETRTLLGLIPTGWYPNDVKVSPDGSFLVVSNGRGVGDGPADWPGPGLYGPGRALRGTISRIEVPDAAALAAHSAVVAEANDRQARYFDFSLGNDTPLPSPGEAPGSPAIDHVFFILKENFSFDCAYGDYEGDVDGNPDWVLWTEDVIPEQRKLAREFVLLDNFYCLSDSSLDGHQWAAAGIETDFYEKYNWFSSGFGTIGVSVTPGGSPESLHLMAHLVGQGIDVLGFGGHENFGLELMSTYAQYVVKEYHGNTVEEVTDVSRAELFQQEFAERLAAGTVPAFSWIFLGNNHGFGLKAGHPIPEYWMGENDKAVGMVVGAIAASPLWERSLIIITEDDSQSGDDHVDKHRSPTLVVSPWVRRGTVSHVVYTINNLHKTVELLLGSAPMHRLDDQAVAMYDVFLARPDLTPYVPILRDVPRTIYDGRDRELTEMSARMDWSEIDRNPDANVLYWKYRKGTEPPKGTWR